jgi:hypothetical protein
MRGMDEFMLYSEIVESNGKTIYQNNMKRTHTIPIGALVEVTAPGEPYDKIRLYVTRHTRDCDGEPLYSLGFKEEANYNMMNGGFGEESLKIVEV